ncbi:MULTISPECIES: hypothetical protein [unclassified Saccharibacter]|uniref:hypothetical protein n=1 Tax=unclassified Saccharibacter TaxID=2648722 RepID=UPI00132C1BA6|nr:MULTISPECIES: hypothetical protein [unclassified Saccharibacter]MXV36836.1 hypothetical protein [Saccharibacter sp. EH611]MXV58674.1 hypothetical protein [Saccharibacter sp. EH70]MXV66180.1 hypothetical protein [Saccharibacter sp. EH60]
MRLYIGNPTHQTHVFSYRLPGDDARELRRNRIGAGQQIVIDDLDPEDCGDIIAQHRAFGFCSVNDARRDKSYRGLVYSDNQAINFQALARGLEDNYEKLTEEGRKNRRSSAEKISGVAMKSLNKRGSKSATRGMEVSVKATSDADETAPSSFSEETYSAEGSPRD